MAKRNREAENIEKLQTAIIEPDKKVKCPICDKTNEHVTGSSFSWNWNYKTRCKNNENGN